MENQSELIFLKCLQESISSLNKLDELIEANGPRQSVIDSELQDILHLIENKEISDSASPKLIKRIHDLRKIRRSLRNEYELIIKYQELKARLSSKENRQFIVAEIQKKIKSLDTEYKNRILTEEQVAELLKEETQSGIQNKKKNIKTAEKSQQINNEIQWLLDMGYSQKEIAIELEISQCNVSKRIKKIKESQNA